MPAPVTTNLVWLRNDLRLQDNPALAAAQAQGHSVQLVFYVHHAMWQRHAWAGAKIDFIKRSLLALHCEADHLNLPLSVIVVDTTQVLAEDLRQRAKVHNTKWVYFNREYPLDERRRDQYVVNQLRTGGIECAQFDDRVCVAPERIKTAAGGVYKVFTPFKRNWYQSLMAQGALAASTSQPHSQPITSIKSTPTADIEAIFSELPQRDLSALWPAGSREALHRLQSFCETSLFDYERKRDIPADCGTSGLSPYLAVGSLSPRQCLLNVLAFVGTDAQAEMAMGGLSEPGPASWMNELIWREYYQYLMFHFDGLSKCKPFKADTQWIPWRTGPEADRDFKAWCDGETGYPIIDAAMLQLKQTGWMHNRLRMITAMFLTKHLLINWRRGEAYFSEKLIDLDFSANNGGWQWSASTGCDAAPYFRIFNPVTQGHRFDSEGKFIGSYFPSLLSLSKKQRHDPQSAKGYPLPIVNLKLGRQRALTVFSNLSEVEP